MLVTRLHTLIPTAVSRTSVPVTAISVTASNVGIMLIPVCVFLGKIAPLLRNGVPLSAGILAILEQTTFLLLRGMITVLIMATLVNWTSYDHTDGVHIPAWVLIVQYILALVSSQAACLAIPLWLFSFSSIALSAICFLSQLLGIPTSPRPQHLFFPNTELLTTVIDNCLSVVTNVLFLSKYLLIQLLEGILRAFCCLLDLTVGNRDLIRKDTTGLEACINILSKHHCERNYIDRWEYDPTTGFRRFSSRENIPPKYASLFEWDVGDDITARGQK